MRETQEIKSMFDKIVSRYDFLNRLLSFWQDILWRKKMATEAVNKETQLVLDLAVGTGDSAKELLKKGAKVIGVDISFEMLRIARGKIQNDFTPVSASAYELPFRDKIFDAVTCAFGIRNMHETEVALREIHRVIKDNGKIIILEFSLPSGFVRKPYLFYLKKIVPSIASLFSVKTAYEYLGSSIEGFYKPEDFTELLQNCGFKNIKTHSLSFGVVYLYVGEKI
ncbi:MULTISPECIES: bifunctional demethylmenaquinone methyltransferase/2-methoxy-6-polyprenyl-1,4-benzoquinol methylase UbiE [Thermodesulfovibrio]|uniref:bifunctional demethylmenaquinone methyltransferase/2-methoxy-6-polyprenyl-1,4-benzoquinol methylase UbiE n=1 Tax=Thermodesulfovibrio yellowstonii TaxID=28262 RepID=UPI00041BC590|nr:bifunctional demethylmenaquinone methyltransferase/2-methoxy-6-polyprenyl-1,4-benzoquinol methylase UbiE [Thermodesulfovibrio islandicus]